MRVFLIHIFCIMASMPAQAQELSVELSVEWMKSKTYLNLPSIEQADTVVIPVLKLTYRNLTGEDIYFRNIYADESGYPKVGWASLLNSQMDLADQVKVHLDYEVVSFQVEIGEYWDVFKQGFDTSQEHERDMINDDLWNIREVLKTQQLLNELGINKQLSCFKYPDKEVVSYREARGLIAEKVGYKANFLSIEGREINEDEVSGQYSDAFVFLKAGHTYEQEISLIGFYLLGGNYEFSITDDPLLGYIPGKDGKRINLPKLVNDHRLYEGGLLTNTIGIKIN